MQVIKPIGGEQWFDINLFNNDLNNFENTSGTFLSGGQCSLNFIVKQLGQKSDEVLLLPAYLCPSIVRNLERNKVNFDFYKINLDLSIDLEDLHKKTESANAKAVFFINYFGFYHDRRTLDYLEALKNHGITLIEDAVQMLWFSKKKFTGDFVFNSFRKFLPVDGSIVLAKTASSFEAVQDLYYEYMNTARMEITSYVKYGIGAMDGFMELFSKAEEVYGKDTSVNGMTEISRYLLNKVDGEYIGKVRRSNYEYLYDRLCGCGYIKPLFGKNLLEENIPIGFPVLIENRDSIRSELRSKSIYCPAHWPILGEKWVNGYKDSIMLAKNILTLPIDQRYGEEDLDRLLREILTLADRG